MEEAEGLYALLKGDIECVPEVGHHIKALEKTLILQVEFLDFGDKVPKSLLI